MSEELLQLTAEDEDVAVTVVLESAINYALVHNGISPLKSVLVENRASMPLGNLKLEIELSGAVAGRIAEPLRTMLPEVDPGETLELDGRGVRWAFDPTTFAQLDEAAAASVSVRVFDETRGLRAAGSMRLLARDEWWAWSLEESLAAFITPRAKAVQDLISEASDLLDQRTGSPAVQGYQLGAGRAMEIARSIYAAMSARDIRYINPPASFEGTGQKIRPPHEVLVDRFGTCLDLATTYAAALEHAGLHPVIVLCQGHAFAGHLLEEQQLPELVLRDQRSILNYVESGLFVPLETVELCVEGKRASFEDAVAATRARWTQGISSVHCLIDVAQAHRVVRPLPAVAIEDGVRIVEVERPTRPRPLPIPAVPAPPADQPRGGQRRTQIYPPRIDQWRNSLLDLSFRNPLLNNRTGRTSLDFHVPHGALGTFEDLLFAGKTLDVIPHDQLAQIHQEQGARTAQDIEPETLTALLEQGTIFGAVTEAAYMTRLRGIQRRAKTVVEETGANNLFVTLGMLEWEDAGRQARAPLFLLPVTLSARRGRPFALRIDDGGFAQPNQCLLEKLRVGHGLTIPQFQEPASDDSGIDLDGAFHAIRLALIEAQLPFTIEESAHLSLLQFSTLQLWQDLSENWESFLQNPVVRHLVETPTDSFTDPAAEEEIAAGVEASAFCPIAVDGSQLEAVSWGEAGRSFVLEGPPGTGKSQTITNLIANALAADQTVLFVAEKQAALDVVKRRLDKVGLGDLCLDLHGKEQTADKVRKQLSAALHLHCTTNPESWAALRSAHQTAVDSLGRYPAALHEPGGSGLSAWTARQALLTAGDGPEVTVPEAVVAAPLDIDRLYATARDTTQALYDLGDRPDVSPWRLADLTESSLAEARSYLPGAVAALAAALSANTGGSLEAVLTGCDAPDAFDAVANWMDVVVASEWAVDATAVDAASGREWQAGLQTVRAQLAALQQDGSSLLSTFTPAATVALDLDDLLLRSKVADDKFLKGKARKAVMADLAPAFRPDAQVDAKALTPTLESLISLRTRARELHAHVRSLPGVQVDEQWNPLAPDAAAAIDAQVRAVEATAALSVVSPGFLEALRATPGARPQATDAAGARSIADAWARLQELLQSSEASLAAWRGTHGALVEAVRAHLPAWSADASTGGLVRLGRWTQVNELLRTFRDGGLQGFADQLCASTIHPDDAEPVLRRSIARAALAERLSVTALSGFDGVVRDRAITRFGLTADEMRRDMVAELPAQIVAERSFSPDRLVGKVGQLSRELSRKRGGQKIRELFTNFGPIIGELTPCLMMSPHSVARFLPAGALDVDLVVFDEASQIKVAEAISAMGRGKATIVVGDSQQMPPSNIAAVTTAADDEDVQAQLGIPADMESVLSEAVESNLPRLWLSWHYRSQHEALISFSNHKYYDGRLASFPRPPGDESGLGVSWRRVNGTFERGKERVNRVEAAAIVEEIRGRLAADAGASIGVVTFNTQQRDLVLDLLEESADPLVAASLANEAEPLFVKNLENVQGDERDVILFSLAFSPNPDTGKLPLNFGPLIQAGGQRRLNVAVTRARAKVVLFSSFDPSHIDLSRSSSEGLAHLRAYMEMAQRADDEPSVLRAQAARDRHHEDVVAALTNAGLRVREHVGLSDFTIDIAVAAADGGPWVAVFLDGPEYANRATVGDRESLPHGVLVGFMGWSCVERIWLPDWIRDREAVVENLVRIASAPPVPEEAPEAPPIAVPVTLPDPPTDPAAVPAFASAAPASLPRPASTSPEQTFVAAHTDHVGDRDMLDELAYDPRCQDAVLEQIEDVLLHESPIMAIRLTRIVGRRFGLARVAAKRAEAILAQVPERRVEDTPFGKVVWDGKQDREAFDGFRTGGDSESSRAIDEIAPHELINAMRFLAKTGGGISPEELVRETAALFGYSRVAAGTRTHLEAILVHGVQVGALADDGTSVTSPSPTEAR